jgi:hypothetical protein
MTEVSTAMLPSLSLAGPLCKGDWKPRVLISDTSCLCSVMA